MRRALQEKQILTLTHGGKSASLQLSLVAPASDDLSTDVVLVTVFDQATTVAAVVFYLEPLVTALSAIVREAAARKQSVDLGEGFDASAAGALDDMFGGEERQRDVSGGEEPERDESGGEVPGADESGGEEHEREESGAEEPRADEPKGDEPGSEEPAGPAGEDLTS